MLGLSGYFIDTIVTRIVSMAAAATTTVRVAIPLLSLYGQLSLNS